MNIGTLNIDSSELHVYIDNDYKDVRNPGVVGGDCNWDLSAVPPNGAIEANCTCNSGEVIKIVAPGNTDLDTCNT